MIETMRNKIDSFLGLKLRFHWSSLILLFIISNIFSQITIERFPEINTTLVYFISILVALCVMLSIIIHEMGHVIAGRRYGIGFSKITIFALGGMATPTNEFTSPKSELITAITGPLASLILVVVSLVMGMAVSNSGLILWIFFIIATLNAMMCIFNLIPAFPLDGGRVLRATIWMVKDNFLVATKYASYTGQFIGGLMIGYGMFRIFTVGGLLNGIWISVIGFIIIASAKQAYSQALQGENV